VKGKERGVAGGVGGLRRVGAGLRRAIPDAEKVWGAKEGTRVRGGEVLLRGMEADKTR